MQQTHQKTMSHEAQKLLNAVRDMLKKLSPSQQLDILGTLSNEASQNLLRSEPRRGGAHYQGDSLVTPRNIHDVY
jgi:hypothetical protein